jgi:hypothetical protein
MTTEDKKENKNYFSVDDIEELVNKTIIHCYVIEMHGIFFLHTIHDKGESISIIGFKKTKN